VSVLGRKQLELFIMFAMLREVRPRARAASRRENRTPKQCLPVFIGVTTGMPS
jgi:hypothetical protein